MTNTYDNGTKNHTTRCVRFGCFIGSSRPVAIFPPRLKPYNRISAGGIRDRSCLNQVAHLFNVLTSGLYHILWGKSR